MPANPFARASAQRFLQVVLADTLSLIGGLHASPAKEQPQNQGLGLSIDSASLRICRTAVRFCQQRFSLEQRIDGWHLSPALVMG